MVQSVPGPPQFSALSTSVLPVSCEMSEASGSEMTSVLAERPLVSLMG
jgi:hypothetical protein